MNTQRWALALGVELVFDPEQDKEVPCQSTKEAIGRRNATIAQKTCVQVAAAALAEAGGNADVFAAARELLAKALVLQDADRITKRDAHSAFRAKSYLLHAAHAVADADGDAAVASARALADAAAAVDRAVEGVKAFEDLDRKIAARRRLEEAEAAFETLYKPYKPTKPARQSKPSARKTAHRPRPNTCTDRLVQQTRRRVAGAPAEEAVWRLRRLPRRRVRQVQVLPRHDEARRPGRAEQQALRPAGVSNAEGAAAAFEAAFGAQPASRFSHLLLSVQQRVVASQAARREARRDELAARRPCPNSRTVRRRPIARRRVAGGARQNQGLGSGLRVVPRVPGLEAARGARGAGTRRTSASTASSHRRHLQGHRPGRRQGLRLLGRNPGRI